MTFTLPTVTSSQTVYKSGAGSLTSWTVNAAPVAGQWQVVFLQQYTISAPAAVITPPSGWVALRTPLITNTLTVAVYAHKCSASDPSTWTFTSNLTTAGVVVVLTGTNPANADPTSWLVSGGTRTGTGTALTNVAPSVTTGTASLVLSLSAERTNTTETSAQVTVDAAWTKYLFVPQAGASSDQSTGIETLAVATMAQAAAGPTGTSTWTYPNSQTSNGWAGLVAIPGFDVAQPLTGPTIAGSGAQSTVYPGYTTPISGLGGDTAAKTLILPKPSGVLDGDLLVALIGDQQTYGTGARYDSPGWQNVQPLSFWAGSRIMDVLLLPVFNAAALPASWTFTSALPVARRSGRVFIVRGVDPYHALGAVSDQLSPSPASAPVPSITTTKANSTLLILLTENLA